MHVESADLPKQWGLWYNVSFSSQPLFLGKGKARMGLEGRELSQGSFHLRGCDTFDSQEPDSQEPDVQN